ncbi:MAG: MBOAT family protein [Planctomycetota bacterium]|nr:MBOAT family protein [Planctomycetota bacterium]
MTWITRVSTVLQGWEILVLGPLVTIVFWPAALPAWAYMWSLSVITFFGCKWLTWRRADLESEVTLMGHLTYLFAWPGMEPRGFFDPRTTQNHVSAGEWMWALLKLAGGLIVLFLVCPWLSKTAIPRYGFAWCGMGAIAFILHFGLFHLLSCYWRLQGRTATPLMNFPLGSTSVADFWGNRWNMAFRDITHRHLFGPLTRLWGPRRALLIGFFFSGLIHDLVISIPAGGGYGLPTLFFMLQALGILVSRSRAGKQLGIHRGIRGWLFTILIVVVPCPLVFHPRFATEVVLPFLDTIGAG